MSVKTCKQHANEPIFIYAQCAACEIQRYRNQVEELKAEVEELRKDAERYRWLRDGADYCDTRDIPGMAPARMDAFIDAALSRGEQS